MPYVEVKKTINAAPSTIYQIVKDMAAYPNFMKDLVSVEILERGDDYTISHWVSNVDGRHAGGASQLVAAEGGGMEEGRFNKALPSSRVADNGADGHHAAAQGLGAGHQVRLHALGVHAEPVAGATDTGLHLVGDEESSLSLTNLLGSP